MASDPRAVYSERLAAARAAEAREAAVDLRLSNARLAVFALAALVAWTALGRQAITAWWLLAPLGAFILLVVWHDRVLGRLTCARRTAAWYERGLARIEDRWIGTGDAGERFLDEQHPYAADLDVFGRASIFELLSTARTRAGEEMLARWLTHGAPAAVVRERQAAARDLAARVDLREDAALAGHALGAEVRSDVLARWAGAPAVMPGPLPWAIAGLFTTASLAVVTAWTLDALDGTRVLSVLAAQGLFATWLRGRVEHVLHGAADPARELRVLAVVLERLERERFDTPLLERLHADLGEKPRASEAIATLGRLAELHDWQHNQVFAPVAALLLWGTHLAFATDRWRTRFGGAVGRWLALVGEFEALAALGTYTFEHPDDVFPAIVEGPARFEATGLAHPLLPRAGAVANDVALGAADSVALKGLPYNVTHDDAHRAPSLLLVSGSNMSGKSTLLRTIGANAVLALAGAPVRAAALTLAPMTLGATLRIQDSLTAGRSRFYAEITRIKQLRDLAALPPPLLFLLDELFHGTNSHDRVAGAAGVLRAFLDTGAIGLVTTHDLAMAAIVADLGPRAANVHFEDQFVGGEMRFDYRLQTGPVTRSNALALMKAVGLDVGE